MGVTYRFQDRTLNSAERAQALLELLTDEEKVSQLNYRNAPILRLGIPGYSWWNEALHGVARAGAATVFPQAIAMAATFSAEQVKWMACVIALEGRIKHYHARLHGDTGTYKGLTFWSPNVNIFRDPRWGRGHETFGECPYLTGLLGTAFVQGVQDRIGDRMAAVATPKHFAVHSGPEGGRLSFNSVVSRKDLFETYLPAFRECVVRGGALSVMTAYNALNGTPCCVNDYLIGEVLRGRWGFDGVVVTDVGCCSALVREHKRAPDTAEAVAQELHAGVDVISDRQENGAGAGEALRRGLLNPAELDQAVFRQLKLKFELGLFDPPEADPAAELPYDTIECECHRKLALDAARHSIVLLKNNGLLPLRREELSTIAVIGPNADDHSVLMGNYFGTPTVSRTLLGGILDACGRQVRVLHARGCHHWKRITESCAEENDCLSEALATAEAADVIVLCLGYTPRMEGENGDASNWDAAGDRPFIEYPDVQVELLQRLALLKKPLVLVNVSGSAVALPERLADAVVQCFYPGAEGGTAVADVLFGKFNPCGRLPVTFYRRTADLPDFRDYSMQNRTYRFFRGEVLYPFGHGLSYTTFKYSGLAVMGRQRDGGLAVEVRVQNTGEMAGEENVLLFVRLDYPGAPLRQLCAVRRVRLKPGEAKTVKLTVEERMLHGFDEDGNEFPCSGKAQLFCGKLKKSLTL